MPPIRLERAASFPAVRVFAPCFTGNATTYLYLGKRDVGLFILNQVMDANPSFFAEAYEEAKKKEEKRDG